MNEHPRPWTYRKAIYQSEAFYIWDKKGEHVASVHDEPTARLIVDLANAAEVQRVRGWYAYPSNLMDKQFWTVVMTCQDELEFGKNNHDAPHEAILAADKWLKAREKGQ